MENLKSGSLLISIKEDTNRVEMNWFGQSDVRIKSYTLEEYLDKFVNDLKNTEVLIKFNDLEYMNSSTVLPVINFIKKLNSNKIKTIITYDSDSRWQVASFKALTRFSELMQYVSVEAV